MIKRTKYGESTVLVSIRVPESKKDEILNRFYSVLNDYTTENPFTRKNDDYNELNEYVVQKKSTASGIDKWKELRATDEEVAEALSSVKVTPEKKKVDMDALRAIANGEGIKSELFTNKKQPIDELYEFEVVKSLPDIDNQVAIDSKGISLYDRYDIGIFYVKWEGRYLRFDNKAEFDRFAKDNNIK